LIFIWSLLQVMLVVAAVQLMGRRAWRQSAAVACWLLAVLLPIHLPTIPLVRALLTALALLCLVKILQVARDPGRWSFRERTWHALVPFDIATTTRSTPALDRRLLANFGLHAAIALLALGGLGLLPRNLPLPLEVVRLVLGGLLVYTGMEALTEAVRLVHGMVGVSVPPLQDRPITSMSIREFWSRRWNRPVSGWLDQFIFEPVARRLGVEWALFAAFAVSALLHAWMFLVASGRLAAIMAGAFFLFQALLVLGESAVKLRQQSPRLRRCWTAGLLCLSSPLFVEPALQVLHL
jgi:hypothetical protein